MNPFRRLKNGDLRRQRKIQIAYQPMTARPGFYRFLASHHL
jgi:hypothetical protein